MSVVRALLVASLLAVPTVGGALLAAPARAADPAPTIEPEALTPADIVTMLKDKNAKLKMDKIIQAATKSQYPFRARDVYDLVDAGAPPEITSYAAGKAKMFWDGTAKSLPAVIQTARDSAPAETVSVTTNDDLVIVFEHFNDLKYGIEAAKTSVGTLQPKQSYEDDVKFDMRKREFDLKVAQTMGPWEGKVSKTTFDVTLQGTFTPHDGSCTRPTVTVDLSKVSFELFRYTMGGLRVDVPIAITGDTNVETARFAAVQPYRFEVTGKPICVSAAAAATLASSGAKLQMKLSRPFDSDKWTGTATFVNAKTGAKL